MPVVIRSAELHWRHIALGGDPFETRSARPLDYGHWLAHRLEGLTGGELPAMTIINGVVRLLPGTVGTEACLEEESHSALLLEHPHYTRPASFRGLEVPAVLRSGDHGAIARWRADQQQLAERSQV